MYYDNTSADYAEKRDVAEDAVKRFIDEYEGTAIGYSIKNQYENGQDIFSIYEQIEDFGF